MFIEFQIGNFRSFRDLQRFTMQAAPLRSNDSGMEEGNVFIDLSFRLLKTKGVYGSNASGKSNLIRAISGFYNMVTKSVIQEGLAMEIWKDRFQLAADWDDQPVFFQYVFLWNASVYRYGFQILEGKVSYEWLYSGSEDDETELFMRTPEGLETHEDQLTGFGSYTKRALEGGNELYREDSLLLTAGALNANKLLAGIRDEIRSIILVDGINDNSAVRYAMHQFIHGTNQQKEAITNLLAAADTAIEGLTIAELPDNLSAPSLTGMRGVKGKKEVTLFSLHSRYDENGKIKDKIVVPFGEWESEGSGKLFGLGALILNAMEKGRTLIIDEFDARFHPNLTLKIVQMFQDANVNPKNAQLIFVSHDTGLLRRAALRRDQICFVDKDRYGVSYLTNLIEYKGVRKDASYEKEYLNGSYKAVPFLEDMESVVRQKDEPYGL